MLQHFAQLKWVPVGNNQHSYCSLVVQLEVGVLRARVAAHASMPGWKPSQGVVQGVTPSSHIIETLVHCTSLLLTAGGDCKADSSPVDAQGSGVIIDDSATVADGVVTATADCVEVPGTTFQVRPCADRVPQIGVSW